MSHTTNNELQHHSSTCGMNFSRTSSGVLEVESLSNGGTSRKERLSPISSLAGRVPLTKLSEERRAKKCRFFRNGDQWFPGALLAINNDKHRTWESLLEDLTRILDHPQHLAIGVRHIFALDGQKITNLEHLIEGCEYVASSTDILKTIDYQKAKLPQWRIHARRKEALHVQKKCNQMTQSASPFTNSSSNNGLSPIESNKTFIKPKLITVIRNGVHPRKAVRILLNHRTARSFEQVLDDITEAIKLDSGAVRKVFATSGRQVGEFILIFSFYLIVFICNLSLACYIFSHLSFVMCNFRNI